eukprot:TRINITY_DN3808_c0_g4_i1.p1 TRINITY_DN3808_c0_g4~~TRINITY_DN3808_c0_g4_i1.p1  ORF type:complete len:107 (-),score=7.48 TRINITY_DN3808_c0_g4_i1:18-338(-)
MSSSFAIGAASGGRLDRLQIASSSLAALRDHVVADFLAFVERGHPGLLHGRDVHEDVLRAVLRLDETEALLSVEPFDGADRHDRSLRKLVGAEPRVRPSHFRRKMR